MVTNKPYKGMKWVVVGFFRFSKRDSLHSVMHVIKLAWPCSYFTTIRIHFQIILTIRGHLFKCLERRMVIGLNKFPGVESETRIISELHID